MPLTPAEKQSRYRAALHKRQNDELERLRLRVAELEAAPAAPEPMPATPPPPPPPPPGLSLHGLTPIEHAFLSAALVESRRPKVEPKPEPKPKRTISPETAEKMRVTREAQAKLKEDARPQPGPWFAIMREGNSFVVVQGTINKVDSGKTTFTHGDKVATVKYKSGIKWGTGSVRFPELFPTQAQADAMLYTYKSKGAGKFVKRKPWWAG